MEITKAAFNADGQLVGVKGTYNVVKAYRTKQLKDVLGVRWL